MAKLKRLLEDIFQEEPTIDRHQVIEGVKNYSVIGEKLYNTANIVEIAKRLSEIAESAHSHLLGEQGDWFDKVSINKNMKALKGNVAEFKKAAVEANSLNQRLTAFYEDIGHVLHRYYEIGEALDKVDPSKVEPEDDFKDRKDKDIDNDGDTDDSDEYLHKKRQAITKAVKAENVNMKELENAMSETAKKLADKPTKRLKDINNVVGTAPIGSFRNTKK